MAAAAGRIGFDGKLLAKKVFAQTLGKRGHDGVGLEGVEEPHAAEQKIFAARAAALGQQRRDQGRLGHVALLQGQRKGAVQRRLAFALDRGVGDAQGMLGLLDVEAQHPRRGGGGAEDLEQVIAPRDHGVDPGGAAQADDQVLGQGERGDEVATWKATARLGQGQQQGHGGSRGMYRLVVDAVVDLQHPGQHAVAPGRQRCRQAEVLTHNTSLGLAAPAGGQLDDRAHRRHGGTGQHGADGVQRRPFGVVDGTSTEILEADPGDVFGQAPGQALALVLSHPAPPRRRSPRRGARP